MKVGFCGLQQAFLAAAAYWQHPKHEAAFRSKAAQEATNRPKPCVNNKMEPTNPSTHVGKH